MQLVFYPGDNVLRSQSHPKRRRRRERDISIYLSRLFSLSAAAAKGRTLYPRLFVTSIQFNRPSRKLVGNTVSELCRWPISEVAHPVGLGMVGFQFASLGGTQSGTGLGDDDADVAVRPTDQCRNAKIPFLPSFLPSNLRVRCNADGFSSIVRCVTWNLNSMPSAYDYVFGPAALPSRLS